MRDDTPKPLHVFQCSPSSSKCECRCTLDGECGHDFSEPAELDFGDSKASVALCSKCGMDNMQHDLWVLP